MRLQDENGKDIGSINFFAVHGTSMFNNNHLVSGDNKGYASYLFERAINGWNNTMAGRGPFVAAFGQSNEGDVSPNIRGAFCTMPPSVAGQPCDPVHSTCAGRNEGCQGQVTFLVMGQRPAALASSPPTSRCILIFVSFFSKRALTAARTFSTRKQLGRAKRKWLWICSTMRRKSCRIRTLALSRPTWTCRP